MQSIDTNRTGALVWIIAVAVLTLAGESSAREPGWVSGEDYLVGMNEARRTLELEDVTIRILTGTRIYNGDNRRISFRQIEVPTPHAPVTVEYEGTQNGESIDARRVVVRLTPR